MTQHFQHFRILAKSQHKTGSAKEIHFPPVGWHFKNVFFPLCISLKTAFHEALERRARPLVSVVVLKNPAQKNINIVEEGGGVSRKVAACGEPPRDLSGIRAARVF